MIKVHSKCAMTGAPQVAMRNASQVWQIFFPSQTLLVLCFSFAKPSDFLFGPSQKGTICSSGSKLLVVIRDFDYVLRDRLYILQDVFLSMNVHV
jgi:hypothetical protein